MRFSKSGTREAVLLLDRRIVTPPEVYSFEPGELPENVRLNHDILPGGVREWARRKGLKYLLYQRPARPWRLWHFRVPLPIHRALGGEEPDPRGDGWVLYGAADGFQDPIEPPAFEGRITRVPGL
jgi:hypothetical protein